MVYQKKCSECGETLDIGGKDRGNLPENAIKFDEKLFCRDCVKTFVEFGTGDVMAEIQSLQEEVDDLKKELEVDSW